MFKNHQSVNASDQKTKAQKHKEAKRENRKVRKQEKAKAEIDQEEKERLHMEKVRSDTLPAMKGCMLCSDKFIDQKMLDDHMYFKHAYIEPEKAPVKVEEEKKEPEKTGKCQHCFKRLALTEMQTHL